MTDACEIMTFPRTTYVVGKNGRKCYNSEWLTSFQLRGVAIDKSGEACNLTKHNAKKLGLHERLTVQQGEIGKGMQEVNSLDSIYTSIFSLDFTVLITHTSVFFI